MITKKTRCFNFLLYSYTVILTGLLCFIANSWDIHVAAIEKNYFVDVHM